MFRPLIAAILFLTALVPRPARANEIGHFVPGVLNIRDVAMPASGVYALAYNYYYASSRLNDRHGDKIESLTIQHQGQDATLDVDVDLDVYALTPMLLWVSPWAIAGAKFGAYVSPTFATTSIAAALTTTTGSGVHVDETQFGLGDLFVQPLWFDWSLEHFDFALGYGTYVPVGRYNTDQVTLPGVGAVTAEAPDNIGLGFWTHQVQGATTWYPWADRRMAVAGAITYEIHHKKQGLDVTAGQNLTLNWGVSQYLPLQRDRSLLLEVGTSGYSSWQVTDDSGDDAHNASAHDHVHAVGAQVGLTHVPWMGSLNLRYVNELAAKDRFQGQSLGLNLAIKTWPRTAENSARGND